jgi:triphosphatase
VSSWWPQKAVRRYLKRLTPAQDALGRHNDVIVATDRFRADAEREPASYFAAGYLLAHQVRTAADAHAALAGVKDARRFWKR